MPCVPASTYTTVALCAAVEAYSSCAVPELWPEKVMRWRAAVCKLWLTCTQIATCLSRFSAGPDRVEIAVSSWGRCLDKSNLWKLLYSMTVRPRISQSNAHKSICTSIQNPIHLTGNGAKRVHHKDWSWDPAQAAWKAHQLQLVPGLLHT